MKRPTVRLAVLSLTALVVTAFLGSAVAQRTPTSTSGPAPAPALPLEQKLEELRLRHEEGSDTEKSFEIEEREANEYLRLRSGDNLPEGVENPWVRFDEGFAVLGATVDLGKVKGEMPDSLVLQLLSGKVPVELTARLAGEKGTGRLVLEKVLLAGIELPPSFVEALAEKHDASGILPEGFRFGEPFALPYDLETIRLQRGAAMVHQRATRGVL